ncbi:hypothetical protein [Helicobacter sp. T3_23-1056]
MLLSKSVCVKSAVAFIESVLAKSAMEFIESVWTKSVRIESIWASFYVFCGFVLLLEAVSFILYPPSLVALSFFISYSLSTR